MLCILLLLWCDTVLVLVIQGPMLFLFFVQCWCRSYRDVYSSWSSSWRDEDWVACICFWMCRETPKSADEYGPNCCMYNTIMWILDLLCIYVFYFNFMSFKIFSNHQRMDMVQTAIGATIIFWNYMTSYFKAS